MRSIILPEILAGKKILFIGVKFYHFNAEIIKKFENYGAKVRFFYERDISVKHAIIDNLFHSYVDTWQEKHYKGILKSIKNEHYDYMFVIRGYKITGKFVEEVKALNPGIQTIMYQWDSEKNGNYKPIIRYFDFFRTFDYEDSRELNLKYVPLFHTDEFSKLPDIPSVYQLFFYGNFTWDRYLSMLDLQKYANENGISLKTHLHISWKRFLMQRLKGTPIDPKYINFKRMDKETYLILFNQAEVIVDITTNAQSGLAMRVIDTLGSGKKLITNNKNIVNEPGFDPCQILIIDPENLTIPNSFLEPRTFKKQDYSIDKWLENIFIN